MRLVLNVRLLCPVTIDVSHERVVEVSDILALASNPIEVVCFFNCFTILCCALIFIQLGVEFLISPGFACLGLVAVVLGTESLILEEKVIHCSGLLKLKNDSNASLTGLVVFI